MKRCRSVCLIALFLGVFAAPLFAGEEKAGIVTKLRGHVTARKTGDEQAATLRAGDAVAAGQTLQASKGSAAQLFLTDHSVIQMLPGTTLQLSQYTFSNDENRRSAVIKVIDGSARFVIYKKRSNDSRFAVISDHVKIGAGFSDFFVTVSGKATEVANIGPSLGVANISPLIVGRVQLGTNQRSTTSEKAPPSEPSTITPEQRRKYLKDAEI